MTGVLEEKNEGCGGNRVPQSPTIRALLAFANNPPKGAFAKLFTKRSGRNKKKSLLRLLRSDFWFKEFSRPVSVAILEL
ncbi:hypothetical protein E3T37_15105 [Cryobacterium sp. TMT2-10]|uniref:hypothetical protein n=1 Tax=unclassified Cryobacterium TaxID=2649013 RepID=UPI00106B6B36|nr:MULTISPECIES: hypothetical protein [unclassified Cryobacterium]TFD20889.1 hypothetical protein E3T42_00930 [Cryobacterium sp. TMT4-10]TFD35835.1 hypothetical protein E3T37_15105 [Cryobacterium sp. TMT2-10]